MYENLFIGIILLGNIIGLLSANIINDKRQSEDTLFEAPFIYKLPLSGIYVILYGVVVLYILGDISIWILKFLTIPILLGVWASIPTFCDIYKSFFYKIIVINHRDKGLIEDIVYKVFEKYNYQLEEKIEYDEKDIIVKGTKSKIAIEGESECT
ncbi:MAG: hypothetical protein N4A57_05905 [Anaeromicrobium sp.]|uniref:hypothetical protein n=1 Tax=Anaeromicrobium sp. TaxID=1929132 RepID=UPI0025D4E056|nr:hypothetical protein [Anaeromicrobium sp.]MCT4593787.1 hypothetical protein [Anaeromicrobium sp.]